MNPPKKIIERIHQIFAKFLWSNAGGAKRKHWVAWNDLCYPKQEGGLIFISLDDVNTTLFAKLWWIFRTSTSSLWAQFLWNKYCKKMHPVIAINIGACQVWRKMVKVGEEIEHEIWWQLFLADKAFGSIIGLSLEPYTLSMTTQFIMKKLKS